MVLEQNLWPCMAVFGYYGRVLQYIAAYCSISQYIAVYRSISQYFAVYRSISHFLAVIDPNSFGLVERQIVLKFPFQIDISKKNS